MQLMKNNSLKLGIHSASIFQRVVKDNLHWFSSGILFILLICSICPNFMIIGTTSCCSTNASCSLDISNLGKTHFIQIEIRSLIQNSCELFQLVFHINYKLFNEFGDQYHVWEPKFREPKVREPIGLHHVITNHENPIHLNVVLDVVHENQSPSFKVE